MKGYFCICTIDIGLVFDSNNGVDSSVVRFGDFDYASNHDRKKSLIGYVFTLSDCDLIWKVILYALISLCTTST